MSLTFDVNVIDTEKNVNDILNKCQWQLSWMSMTFVSLTFKNRVKEKAQNFMGDLLARRKNGAHAKIWKNSRIFILLWVIYEMRSILAPGSLTVVFV